ncbi:MAG: carboxypeptidase regulatory-like domain-containing protein [Bacteroidales bacterium]|jgi:hypothetical protein|nr:carboxypeptidase regulatory-like domain-containing protein [Bacteroidales bacterium]
MRKILLLFNIAFFSFYFSYSQVTTASLTGKISDDIGILNQAVIKALHEPSGTVYATTSNAEGYYYIQGMRTGGPYSVEVSYIGYITSKTSNIFLTLGQTTELNIKLKEQQINLPDVEISASKYAVDDKEGASTIIRSKEIKSLPTISRSITDFTVLTPQSGKGSSYAGRDGRFNNITIDGADFNNSYGLSANNLPGGDAQPISLDAIEEISVNLTPYDIRQSNFTGANINAITKSGTNVYAGTAYTFLRPKSLTGNLVDETVIANANDRSAQLYGFNAGGAIVKNKLFFFVSGEYEKQIYPNTPWTPSANGESDASKKISRTSIADMQTMKDFLTANYGYDPGKYLDRDDFNSNNYKILARLDWNINQNHRLMIRYNDVMSKNDMLVNPNSAPRPRASSDRIGAQAMAFSNTDYMHKNIVRSITGELNSVFGSKFSNSFLASYTRIRDTRDGNGDSFPFVDIYKDGDIYMSFGYELFTYGTDLTNDALNIVNNFSAYFGKHTLTAGISFNYLHFKNSYIRYGLGYYRYDSMEDFMNNAQPTAFGITYGYNSDEIPYFKLNFGMGSIYLQDEWHVSEKLRLTGGVRLEMPFYMNKLPNNPSVNESLPFYGGETIQIDQWPNGNIAISPRLGFNWKILDGNEIIMRGGTGVFTGFMPFVWLTNQAADNGMMQNTVEIVSPNIPSDMVFETDFRTQLTKYPELFSSTPSSTPPGQISFADPDFRLPQIWRSNIAFDFKLPADMIFTIEGIYGKDINAVIQQNINQCNPSGTIKEGEQERDSWWTKEETSGNWIKKNKIQPNISYAMKLTNAKEGYQYSITGQLVKKFSYGVSGTAAYTYSMAKDLTANPGSASVSMWTNNATVNGGNSSELSYSAFSVPHRIVSAITWSIESGKNLGFSISLLYQGSAQGRYSYIYNGDVNGDNNSSDLIYIPRDQNEIVFVETDKMTAAAQAKTFWNFVENDEYLKNNKGKFAERNGVVGPWINRIDLKITQDLFSGFGTDRRYTLQLSLDVLNLGNLLNPKWGCYQSHGMGNTYNQIGLLKFEGLNQEGTPTFTLNASDIENFNENARFSRDVSVSSTWGAQIGLRFIF